jgi:glutamyl-Q tRNA(Asp) synthetase
MSVEISGAPAPPTAAAATYRGRFAPSPTGPLHLGSLVAALGSYLEARTRGGEWLVRIEDLDRARVVTGASDSILRTLVACGMHWDRNVVYQSRRADAYHASLHRLHARGLVYACACSRREIADSALAGIEGPVYPGTCRAGIGAGKTGRALRLRTTAQSIDFIDQVQGPVAQRLQTEIGDFVLRRADGQYAYQLAVAVDDWAQGISDIVRGADLLASTPRQIYLQRLLGFATPRYLHLPAVVDERGEKLSKQTRAAPVDSHKPLPALFSALQLLGQRPPGELKRAGLGPLWDWAMNNWDAQRIPRARSVTARE